MTETGPEFIWPRNPPLYIGESIDLEWLYVATLYYNNKSDWRYLTTSERFRFSMTNSRYTPVRNK